MELEARYDIKLEKYWKVLNIEALTMVDMVKKGIIGSVVGFMDQLSGVIEKKKNIGLDIEGSMEMNLIKDISANADEMMERLYYLENALYDAKGIEETYDIAKYYKEKVTPAMEALRDIVDKLELLVPHDMWPYPSYGELLYSA